MSKSTPYYVVVPHDFGDHPKTQGLSLEAIGLWVLCMTWSHRNLTDGHLPANVVRQQASLGQTPWADLAQELLDARLWERPSEDSRDFQVHEWAVWQQTKEEIEAARNAIKKHGSKGGKESMRDRPRCSLGHGLKRGEAPGPCTHPSGVAKAQAKSQATSQAQAQATSQHLDPTPGPNTPSDTQAPAKIERERERERDVVPGTSSQGADAPDAPVGERDATDKPARVDWRPQDGESTAAYRDRLRRAYMATKPGQTRNDIAYAWACHVLGQGNVQYGAVMGLLRRAGSFDTFLRAISRTGDQGVMEDPVRYAMGVLAQDFRRGNVAKPGTFTAHATDPDDGRYTLYADFDR